jgi:hypothetical protein
MADNKPTLSPEWHGVSSRVTKILLSGWSLLQVIENRKLDQKTVAQYCGLSDTTFSNWTAGATDLSQIEALLRLLERLPDTAQLDFLTSFLRRCPTLNSHELAHDPIAVRELDSLLDQRRGLTFIQAERDFLRSFVLTAIGHAASRIGSAVRPIAGLDQHQEDAFVPIPGVTYLGRLSDTAERQRQVRGLWPLTQSGSLVLINGLWLEFPNLQQQLIAAAETRHIVIADDTQFDPRSLRQILGSSRIPGRILMLSELPGDRISIHFALA